MAAWAAAPAVAAGAVPAGYPANYAETIAGAAREGRLVIYSPTELQAVAPLLKEFRAMYPRVQVEYLNMSSLELDKRFASERAENSASADVLWSPAMDLQMKLVNDGHALVYRSPEAGRLPAWAVWRNEAFGTTYEPAVIVFNRRLLGAAEVPRSRADLIRALRERPERFRGKVATYDIDKVGVGFLFATQDAQTSSQFWELTRALFAARVQLHASTAQMMERVASGECLIAYNLLGPYAMARSRTDPALGVVLPRDYTLVMSRIAFINKRALHPNAARLWIDFLLSRRGQGLLANESQLFSLRSDVEGETTAAALAQTLGVSMKPIAVGPGLLTYRDQAKRIEFIRKWQTADSDRDEAAKRAPGAR
jgi:iron(III) transport system substrate-binding protein